MSGSQRGRKKRLKQLEILMFALRPSHVAAERGLAGLKATDEAPPFLSSPPRLAAAKQSENGLFFFVSTQTFGPQKPETPRELSDGARGSVTVLVTGQDVEVAQGRGVVRRATLQNHHPAGDT